MRVFLLPSPAKKDFSVVKSTDLYPKPLNTIGYNYFQVQTNDSIYKLLLAPENIGKKFYYIMENLTSDVSYDKNINTISSKYFGDNVDNNFLQLWEILLAFNLVEPKVSTNDETLKNVFTKLKKYSKLDIINTKKLSHLCMLHDISFETTELEISKKITKFLNNLELLEKGGCMIIKVKELIHAPSIHLLYLLSNIFEEVYIYRPELSYISRGERYIVCKNYKDEKLKYELSSDYLTLNMNLPTDYIFTVNIINRILMQEEYIVRNKMRNFINSQNYYGDEYHTQLALQQNNSDNWIANNLVLSSKDYDELKKIKEKELDKSVKLFESLVEDKTKLVL
jgi:hypothetical protein